MERWRGKTALVTGASCGIGYETSKQLARLGLNVVGCARNVEKIQVGEWCTEKERETFTSGVLLLAC